MFTCSFYKSKKLTLRYAEYLTPSAKEDFRDLAGNGDISFCFRQWIKCPRTSSVSYSCMVGSVPKASATALAIHIAYKPQSSLLLCKFFHHVWEDNFLKAETLLVESESSCSFFFYFTGGFHFHC